MRAEEAFNISGRLPIVNGDDTVEDCDKPEAELLQLYAARGKVMEYQPTTHDSFELCSHLVTNGPDGLRVEYQNLAKSAFRFAHNPTRENYEQLRRLVRTPEQIKMVQSLQHLVPV
jgi:hypothetical protein